jgi:hypothetical protein
MLMKHFPGHKGLVSRACALLAFLLLLALCPVKSPARGNLHGSARLMGMDTEFDTSRTRSLDQQYMVNYNRTLLPYVNVHLSLTYHDVQTFQMTGPDGWQGELMPSGNLNWTTQFFSVGANYRYRQIRNLVAISNSHSQGAGAFLKTKFRLIPQSTVSYDWNRYTINAGLQPLNTEDRRFQYATNYAYKRASSYYTYSNHQSKNLTNDISQNLQQHIFRLDYSNTLLSNRLQFGGNYLFNFTRRRQESNQSAIPVTLIPSVLGLYSQDSNPGLGFLDTLGTLIDGDVNTSTGINLGGAFLNQNIGFDLSLVRTISLIYLYTDRPSNPGMVWSLYSSEDNLTWNGMTGSLTSSFNDALNRYEIAFSAASARYFKIVNSTVDEKPEVYVTEVQAYISSQMLAQNPDQSWNHRVSSGVSYQIHSYWRLGVDAVFGSLVEDATGQQRQDANASGTVNYQPNEKFSSTARYQRGMTDYKTGVVSSQESELYSIIFVLSPIKTVETSLSGSRLQSWQNQVQSQLVHSSLLRVSTLVIPGLSTLAEAGFSRTERPSPSVLIVTDSWTYRVSADATPYQNLNLISTYTLQLFNSNYLYADGRRDQVDLRFTYRATPAIFLHGGITYGRESESEDLVQDYSVSWDLTRRISAGANARFQHNTGNQGSSNNSRTLNAQLNYLLSDRVNFYGGFSQNRITNAQTEESSSYQVGLNASF